MYTWALHCCPFYSWGVPNLGNPAVVSQGFAEMVFLWGPRWKVKKPCFPSGSKAQVYVGYFRGDLNLGALSRVQCVLIIRGNLWGLNSGCSWLRVRCNLIIPVNLRLCRLPYPRGPRVPRVVTPEMAFFALSGKICFRGISLRCPCGLFVRIGYPR